MSALPAIRAALLMATLLLALAGQPTGSADSLGNAPDPAAEAYAALEQGKLEAAREAFHRAVKSNPASAALRKDFGYTLLRMGETAAARDQFAEVVRLAQEDSGAALEYAFLCQETGKPHVAWTWFRKLRTATNPEHRETARATFERLDAELRVRIERLSAVLDVHPEDDAAHVEVAEAHAIRNDHAKAAAHYEAAFRLKPAIPERLLDLANVAERAGDAEKARAARLLASRSDSAFVAEQARGLLPDRYPYLYEFQNALALQPSQQRLRREMAFFLVALDRPREAIDAFRELLRATPSDLVASAQLGFLLLAAQEPEAAEPYLRAALAAEDTALRARVQAVLGPEALPPEPRAVAAPSHPDGTLPAEDAPIARVPDAPATARMQAEGSTSFAEATRVNAAPPDPSRAEEARAMGRKSYDQGFLPDAIRYYREAHELDPTDFDTMLRLAYSLNMAQRDQEAMQWFFLAARSPDATLAAEATKALRNLTTPAASGAAQAQAQAASPRTGLVASLWAMPLHSTRWGSTFAYSQAKTELELPRWPIVPYLSLRFVGDTTGAVGQANPQFLSENAFILGGGLRTRPRHGLLFWAEAGSAMAYLGSQRQASAQFAPDYRGGISQFQLAGRNLLASSPGWFAETMNDLVYIHRFGRNTLAISRNRLGHHFGKRDSLGGLQFQLFLNLNANTDFKRQAWANFIEAGPGIRFRWSWMPPSVSFTFSALRGHHPIARSDGRPNTYTDFQAGLWYAVTH